MEKSNRKNNNRFKFIPFSERISNVNIDVFHRVPHRFEEETTEKFTYFYLAIRKWTVLNLTGKWKAFRKEVGYDNQTLPQLINNKNKIFNVFLKNIRHLDELSLQPVLELMVAFVKDLRHEFYPFYPQTLKELIFLLKSQDPDILELTFTCLAYIFKYLSKELVKDLDIVLLDLAVLFCENYPVYVRDFAAQSFSFVARKVKDKNKLLSLVLYAVQTSPEISGGCAQLLFEMMKGIKGKTHSCAEEMFFVLFNSFGKQDVPQKSLGIITSQVAVTYANNISPQESVLFKVIIEAFKTKLLDEDFKGLKKLLRLTNSVLKCKEGAHLKENYLPEIISVLLKTMTFSEKIQKIAVLICADMLQLNNLKVPQESASRIITKVMQIHNANILLPFISETSNSTGFETSILPKAFQNPVLITSQEFLELLTKIVVEKTNSQTVTDFCNSKVYNLALNSAAMQILTITVDELKNFSGQFKNFKIIICSLILVRHFQQTDQQSTIVSSVNNIVIKLIDVIKTCNEEKQKYFFVLCVALETLVHFKQEYMSSDGIDAITFLDTMLKNLKSDKAVLILKSFNLFLTLHDEFLGSDQSFWELYAAIQDWLLSPQTNVHLLAIHSLKRLEELKSDNTNENLMIKILQDALDAELMQPTISNYRDKLILIEKLSFENVRLLDEEKHQVLLKYLLGVLYCNFQLLWEPVSNIITTYSGGMSGNGFWEIFFSQLRSATAYCKGIAPLENFNLPVIDGYLLDSVRFIRAKDRADYENYRNLMWTVMSSFSDLCETKSRDIISIYLPFIENEILKFSAEHGLTVNIKKLDSTGLNKSNEYIVEDSSAKGSYASTLKCAIAQLTVLSKFKYPKQCYREPDVRNSYFSLLLHKNLEIQKKALECLFKYKFNYMTPYKNNLWNLIDEGKFKNELIHFQVDTESGMIKDIHREELMPIVMRILYNKMLFLASTPRGNKSSAISLRRSIILKFLAGISQNEMEIFLKMAFRKWNSYCESEIFQFKAIIESVDLERVPLLKKLQNAVNLADTVLSSFGGLMSQNIQHYILKVVLSIGSYLCGIFAKRDQIYSGYILSLKNIRTSCMEFIIKFFDRFEKFNWTENDIDALFHIFIWPNLLKLPVEGVHGPSHILRLFLVWSKNPRYFKLLARYHKDDQMLTPLPFIMDLLLNEMSVRSVTSAITCILENLLTLEEEDERRQEKEEDEKMMDLDYSTEKLPTLEVEFILPVFENEIAKLQLKEEPNYGSKLLFPHVGKILAYLRRNLETSDSQTLGKEQMVVLSRISEMATSAEHGDALMLLLIKVLSTRKQTNDDGDDIIVNMISTLKNLINVVTNPSGYLRQLSVLFGVIELNQARKALIDLTDNIEKRCPNLKQVSSIIRQVNAWDSKWVDQPDYEKRLDAFKEVKALVDKDDLHVDLAFIILHNFFYFIKCESDLSLRDNVSFYLKEICPKIAHSLKDSRSLRQQWIENILSWIKNGIVSQDENFQAFSISLLGVMARECGTLHPVLIDLSVLTNKSDPEVDFFENAQHLQIYRRMKALLKFSNIAKTLKKAPTTRTLVQFILPLATRYLANTKYSGKNSLIDAAIEAVATVCKFLPWNQYQMVLRFYLAKLRKKLEFQKQLTRLVIAILDSFHFDISHSPTETVRDDFIKTNSAQLSSDHIEKVTVKDEKINQSITDQEPPENKKGENKEEKTDGDDVCKGDEFTEREELLSVLEKDVEAVEEEQEQKNEEPQFAIDSIVVLKPHAALKVEKSINDSLLNQLYKVMARKSQTDVTHKLNYQSLGLDKEEEDLLKIPLAVTIVKLLQKLPERILNTQLPGIFMRLCAFLKSRIESIRRVTRETIQQILVALGAKYLPLILKEMSATLTKGFQVHVLVYTIHAIIQNIHHLLKPGDIDVNLPILLETCKTDLFGAPSEEKTVIKIQAKHKEAKATKSYHLINIIAQYVTEKCLTDIIVPVKEVLQNAYTHKNIVKCREFLRQITLGLSVNQFISLENVFIYIYGAISESIPQLLPESVEPLQKKKIKVRQDCFIIPPEPKTRMGILNNAVKKGSKVNSHVIVEFGLSLLRTILKKEKLKNCDLDIRCYLDPIGPLLIESIESEQVKVSTLSIQCLSKFFKYQLPSIEERAKKICDSLFSILHKYAAAGLCKGNNFDLVLATFKAVSIFIRETNCHGITAEQLKILLLYTEQDIYDAGRQATAFTLLKTILQKKLNSPELHDIMHKVAVLSITSVHAHVRQQARQNVFYYTMNYPLKNKVEDIIGFYTSQLNYEVESGRQSSMEMIKSFITYFPEKKLEELSGVFLLTLGASLINDDSPDCKKTIAGLIKVMLTRLDKAHRDRLFEILLFWLEEKNLNHRRLGAQIAGTFVSVEKELFNQRLPIILPIMQKQFVGDSRPGQFVRVANDDAEENRLKDHLYFQVLQLLMKICSHCPNFITCENYQENVHFFTEISQSLLCHAHEWIRYAAAQFLGYVFNSCEPSDVSNVLNGTTTVSKLSFLEPLTIHGRIKSLILDHCAQFIPGADITQEFLDQLVKNLVYLGRVLSYVRGTNEEENDENDREENYSRNENDDSEKPNLTFLWIIKRMRRIVNMELGLSPSSRILRMAVLKWIGAIAMCSSRSVLKSVLYHLMAPVVREREFTDPQDGENPMKTLVTEIIGVLKKKVGIEVYSREAIKIKTKLMERRMERKNKRAQEFIMEPEKAAKRKIERQKKKREARKRKLEKVRERKVNKFKRRKLND